MFEFLRKLARRSEEVLVVEPGALDVVGYGGGFLRFVSLRPVPLEACFQAVIDLPDLGLTPVPLKVVSRAPHEDGTLHVAAVEADEDVLARLEARFGALDETTRGEPTPSGPEQRACPRYAVTCRVTSPALPHFHGTMVGLSAQGARLALRGQLAPGTRLTLTVELGEPDLPPVDVVGTVIWASTRPRGDGFWLGLRFVEMPGRSRRVLDTFLERLQARNQPPE